MSWILTTIATHVPRYESKLSTIIERPANNPHQSYHDLAVRLEPIILELEREENDLLIIAHESVLRVLYGYLMACNAADIPFLEFPRDEIIEVYSALNCVLFCSIQWLTNYLIDHSRKLPKRGKPNSYPWPSRRDHSRIARGFEDPSAPKWRGVSDPGSWKPNRWPGNTPEWLPYS
jgi:hypothetical protein